MEQVKEGAELAAKFDAYGLIPAVPTGGNSDAPIKLEFKESEKNLCHPELYGDVPNLTQL